MKFILFNRMFAIETIILTKHDDSNVLNEWNAWFLFQWNGITAPMLSQNIAFTHIQYMCLIWYKQIDNYFHLKRVRSLHERGGERQRERANECESEEEETTKKRKSVEKNAQFYFGIVFWSVTLLDCEFPIKCVPFAE